ncbi:hypothetical protein I4641_18725 [Waterburya agarophytonicola K14]|uniref:Uncharacterized protein n=1 Tax=Waterburya agarophytonicola KI4 TaxID=2874699 RepID=A0A964FHC0_9CYAN|nr:hypothetical protein [Waterburya agarophytonicola]MCC0179006.1 hypothetical protein [Waterburya agarophytonicola KI4]
MSSITSSVDTAVSEFVANGLELIGTDEFDNLKGSKDFNILKSKEVKIAFLSFTHNSNN